MDRARHLAAAHQHFAAPREHIGDQVVDAVGSGIVLAEDEQREAGADQGHRPVPNLGGAERLGMEAASLLELERGFLRHAEAQAAADHIEAARAVQPLDQRRPVGGPGGLEPVGQCGEAGRERLVACPFAHQVELSGERGDVRLGRRDADLGSGAERHQRVRFGREGRILDIDHRHGAGAAFLRGAHRGQDVGALARLRDAERQHVGIVGLDAIDRGDRRRD